MPADDFATAISRARDLVRAGKPQEATRLIQAALANQPPLDPTPDPLTDPRPVAAPAPKPTSRAARRIDPAGLDDAETADVPPPRKRRPLGDVITGLTKNRPRRTPARGTATSATIPQGARFDWRSIDTPQGSRDYRLFVPSALPDGPQGLVLMLHGCTQDPDDFVAGTQMNAHAERLGLVVAYPAQTRSHNAQSCWNWFRPADQGRDRGEPAILAALARTLAAEFRIPSHRVFAAGLSAGGAMAAILGHAYPDLFSAIAIHSGLAAGSAHDVVSAFAAMRGDGRDMHHPAQAPRTITFHGTADSTVHPANSAHIMTAARLGGQKPETAKGTAGGRSYTRSRTLAPDGTALTEDWLIDGAGHAWSGGSPAGSYTDARGPDATALMLDFFLHAGRGGT